MTSRARIALDNLQPVMLLRKHTHEFVFLVHHLGTASCAAKPAAAAAGPDAAWAALAAATSKAKPLSDYLSDGGPQPAAGAPPQAPKAPSWAAPPAPGLFTRPPSGPPLQSDSWQDFSRLDMVLGCRPFGSGAREVLDSKSCVFWGARSIFAS